MDLDEIKQILEMMREHELAEFELERENIELRLRKNTAPWPAPMAAMPQVAYATPVPQPMAPAIPWSNGASSAPVLTAANEDVDFAIVKSPIVGTFYRAPEPGAPNFVEVGASVRKGQVLCIIEAMKLMNEIECDTDGEITAVYVENGRAVQFGDRLYAVRVSRV